jgi:hypothetical protein
MTIRGKKTLKTHILTSAVLAFSVLAAHTAIASAGIRPVIDAAGYLALSNGAPLSGYQADEALLRRFRTIAEPCVKELPQEGYISDPGSFCPNGPKLAREAALLLNNSRVFENVPELNGMLPEEIAGYFNYYGSGDHGFVAINSSLWNKKLPEDRYARDMMMLLLSGINRLPDYRGKAVHVDFALSALQGGTLTAKKLEARMNTYREPLKRGEPYIPMGFWSSSWVDATHTGTIDNECNALIVSIESLTGKNTYVLMRNPIEREVLFRPATKFEILSVSGKIRVPKTSCNKLGYGYKVAIRELP